MNNVNIGIVNRSISILKSKPQSHELYAKLLFDLLNLNLGGKISNNAAVEGIMTVLAIHTDVNNISRHEPGFIR